MSKGASKYMRAGGKFTGNHGTLIPLAARVCDIVEAIAYVTKITPGFIRAGIKSRGGLLVVKITDQSDKCVLLSIRHNGLHQEVYVYVTDLQEGRTQIARKLRDNDIAIRFIKE